MIDLNDSQLWFKYILIEIWSAIFLVAKNIVETCVHILRRQTF